MTHEAKVNLGELFNQKIKQQPINSVKTRKIHQGNGKNKYGQSGIIGVAKVDSPNYSQGYFFVLKYRNDENRYQFIQKKSLKELYEYAQSKGLDFIVDDKKKARSFIDKNSKSDDEYKFLFYNIILQTDYIV